MTNNATNDIICPLCNSKAAKHLADVKDFEYFTSDELFTYFECVDCRCIYLPHPPISRLDEIYPSNYYSNEGPSSNDNYLDVILLQVKHWLDKRLFASVLKQIHGDSIKCLDVGGGSGWLLNIIRKADKRVSETTVLDINHVSKNIAEKNGHQFVHGTVESLGRENEFDFAFALNLIEHVADPRSVLLGLNKALKPGKMLLIKTPNANSLNRKVFQKIYWGGYHAPRHWVLFDRENFFSLALETGFEISEFKYTQGAPQWVASVLGTLSKLKISKKNVPMIYNPLTPWLTIFFAAFDLVRAPFFKTDQMIIALKKI
jgi:2-polyprenyl-3-methyl-5-hydroxy-6-metoxy-1,4-benzoquinol methylase